MGRKFGIAALGVLLAVLVLTVVVWWKVDHRLARVWEVEVAPVSVIGDVREIARGAHLAETRGCNECHDADLGGKVFLDDPLMGHIVASNLTTGRGGVLAGYSDAQLARAIRHGLRANGRSLIVMPTPDYFPLGDEDVGALIAYLRQRPPVDRELGASSLGPVARALLVFSDAPWISAESVDHAAHRAPAPSAAINVDYGRYVAATCISCHGASFAGGIVNGPPGTPASANLTPAGALRSWTEADFLRALREGRTPDGRELLPAAMPWPAFSAMNDTELRALWLFLQSLPAATPH